MNKGNSSNSGGNSSGNNSNSNRRGRPRGNNNRRPSSTPNRNQSYDSNGPEVRVRGSAQQVLDKYLQLARDAQSAGDRILAESYLQYAEHYFRIVNENRPAQPEPQQQQQQQQQQQPEVAAEQTSHAQPVSQPTPVADAQPAELVVVSEGSADPVEEPKREARPRPRTRRPRKPAVEAAPLDGDASAPAAEKPAPAAEKTAPAAEKPAPAARKPAAKKPAPAAKEARAAEPASAPAEDAPETAAE